MANKVKLKISREGKNGALLRFPEPFEVLLNPASYQRDVKLALTCERKMYKREPEKLELPELVLDGTGVVPTGGAKPRTVAQQLDGLMLVILGPMPSNEPRARPVVVLTWGTLYFRGRVESVSVNYTLFAPDGVPLRAKVALSFLEPEEFVKAPKPSAVAPKLTQQIAVEADNLPNISFKVFNDPARHEALARASDLDSLRNVPPGTRLIF